MGSLKWAVSIVAGDMRATKLACLNSMGCGDLHVGEMVYVERDAADAVLMHHLQKDAQVLAQRILPHRPRHTACRAHLSANGAQQPRFLPGLTPTDRSLRWEICCQQHGKQ